MLNNIGTATANKISIAILSCIDNMISYTNTIEDNITLTPPLCAPLNCIHQHRKNQYCPRG
ncbi:hypothetical protein [uncultured Gammaproteobacteria bacterium]|nr:hypothetical protein [uncultured Gammaproteobacteria bacterium]CAC9987717.1 hypothetical protein [uncultured Gammaproteobacteria bacterium]